MARSRRGHRGLTGRGFSEGAGRALGQLRINRAFAAGAGPQPNTHKPITLSSNLDETVARSPNLIVPRCERASQISIATHYSEIPTRSQAVAANLEGGGSRVSAIPTHKSFGWRQRPEINGSTGSSADREGSPIGRRVPYECQAAIGSSSECCKSRPVTETDPGMANAGK